MKSLYSVNISYSSLFLASEHHCTESPQGIPIQRPKVAMETMAGQPNQTDFMSTRICPEIKGEELCTDGI